MLIDGKLIHISRAALFMARLDPGAVNILQTRAGVMSHLISTSEQQEMKLN